MPLNAAQHANNVIARLRSEMGLALIRTDVERPAAEKNWGLSPIHPILAILTNSQFSTQNPLAP